MTHRIAGKGITAFPGHQVIIWITPEHGDEGEDPKAVRVSIDEAPEFLQQFATAYANCMQELAIELAAGGCRTCKNDRTIIPEGEPVFGFRRVPCPTCVPRAEQRIRKAVTGLRPRERTS